MGFLRADGQQILRCMLVWGALCAFLVGCDDGESADPVQDTHESDVSDVANDETSAGDMHDILDASEEDLLEDQEPIEDSADDAFEVFTDPAVFSIMLMRSVDDHSGCAG